MSLPPKSDLIIQFAHVAYRLAERFALRETGIAHFQTWSLDDTRARLAEVDVLVLSGFWRNDFLPLAPKLRFIQVSAAGFDSFDVAALERRGVRMASGRGINKNAVSEHAMALILAFTRQLHTGRDHQRERHWRGMISDLDRREEELGGKTLLIYGLGGIGSRLATLARAFDMHVIGIKREPRNHDGSAHEVHPPEGFIPALARADFVALTCPLTDATRSLMDARAFAAMRKESYLINVARGGCVHEPALVRALLDRQIAGAGIDTSTEEPLPEHSPLWALENVIITPHTGGETRRYEDNVIDLLLENLRRLWRGTSILENQVV